jgi:hypothetical protein
MKFSRMTKQDIPVTHLLAAMEVRYWEDARVNGVAEDNAAPTIPFALGETWVLKIELETGRIVDWPQGTTASVHYKVCDAGVYRLLNATGEIVAVKDDYVPSMLCPKGNGYGDYVIMDISGDGIIDKWRVDLSYFEEAE